MTFWLFVDDERQPPSTWDKNGPGPLRLVARNKDEARMAVLMFGTPRVISLDHDLGDNQPTGYDVLQMLITMHLDNRINLRDTELRVHSMNPVGAENIQALWDSFQRSVLGE